MVASDLQQGFKNVPKMVAVRSSPKLLRGPSISVDGTKWYNFKARCKPEAPGPGTRTGGRWGARALDSFWEAVEPAAQVRPHIAKLASRQAKEILIIGRARGARALDSL